MSPGQRHYDWKDKASKPTTESELDKMAWEVFLSMGSQVAEGNVSMSLLVERSYEAAKAFINYRSEKQ